MSANSSAVYLTICSLFAIPRSPQRDDPLVLTAPDPHDRMQLSANLSCRDNAVFVIAARVNMDDGPPVEHVFRIAEVEPALMQDPQPLCLVPFEHRIM